MQQRLTGFIFLFLIIMWNPEIISAQTPRTAIIEAFREGDAGKLSGYFNTKVTLNIKGKEDEYSRDIAIDKMKIFFNSEEVQFFNIIFQGTKKNSNFMIGQLKTKDAYYRVNLFFRKSESGEKIHLLRIESENETGF